MNVAVVRQWGNAATGSANHMNGAYADVLDLRSRLGPFSRATAALQTFGGSWGSVLGDLQDAVAETGDKLLSSANAVAAADESSRAGMPAPVPLPLPSLDPGPPGGLDRPITVDVPLADPNLEPQGTYGPYLPGHRPATSLDETLGIAPTWANGSD